VAAKMPEMLDMADMTDKCLFSYACALLSYIRLPGGYLRGKIPALYMNAFIYSWAESHAVSGCFLPSPLTWLHYCQEAFR